MGALVIARSQAVPVSRRRASCCDRVPLRRTAPIFPRRSRSLVPPRSSCNRETYDFEVPVEGTAELRLETAVLRGSGETASIRLLVVP